ncbi:cytochrome P450 CYP12A2 [Biomphalaria pfeifferi]|uniref:Cytochrome P450 CYP12A2 n=1 Tax=Biomphalaria pfeifferi TaxID=112525 RepID=A0AAD8BRU1_BIOPF|nr:cytochrome P450 CYP12A2 [Biomphalaria pfeifferi]
MNYGKKSVLFPHRPSSRSIESESVLSFDDLEDDEKDNVKRKTRNLSEKKRRDQFNILINELCSMVASNTKKLDKSSVLKSAIQFLKNHQEFSVQSAANEIKENWKPTFLCNEEFAQLMLEAVDSFLVVFTQQGKVLFTSDSVTSLLGHLPSDLINHSLYDLMHEDDRLKFFNLLSKQQTSDDNSISFTCHLRRGTIDPMEPATYEYVRVCGTTQLLNEVEDDSLISNNGDFIGLDFPEPTLCYCCTVRLQMSHIIREMSVVDDMTCEFTSRHSLELKFLFLDHRAPPIIGYLPFEVLGTSGYDYYHPDDLEVVSKCHEQLMLLGKGTSKFYRFLTKGQQWIWLQTQYFITYHQWNSKPEFIVCTNTVVGFSDVRKQLRKDLGYVEADAGNVATVSSNSNSNCGSNPSVNQDSQPQQEGHVTSFSQSENIGKMVQSPDVASTQLSDNDCPQQPHSTKQESSTKKHVSSQLQSLLQLHLQRSLAASNAMQAGLTTTAMSTTKCVASSSSLVHSMSETKSSGQLTNSVPSVLSTSNHQVSNSQARSAASLVPIMAAMSNNLVTMGSGHRLLSSVSSTLACQDSVIVSSPLSSPIVCADQRPNYQTSLILTPAQQLLHEQLVHKSELLQNAIQRQQEELRMIKEQLAFTHGSSQIVNQQQRQLHQPSHLQQQQQHQYVLQQQLGNLALPGQSMLLTQANNSSQLAMMSSSPNHIFLSPVRSVGIDLQSQQQQQQQPQRQFLQQQQQLVLQHDSGLSSHSMLLSPISSSPQLTMMSSNPNQIFLSPINMDMLTGQSQQQQQQQQQTLHFLGVTCSSSDPTSNTMDLSD